MKPKSNHPRGPPKDPPTPNAPQMHPKSKPQSRALNKQPTNHQKFNISEIQNSKKNLF